MKKKGLFICLGAILLVGATLIALFSFQDHVFFSKKFHVNIPDTQCVVEKGFRFGEYYGWYGIIEIREDQFENFLAEMEMDGDYTREGALLPVSNFDWIPEEEIEFIYGGHVGEGFFTKGYIMAHAFIGKPTNGYRKIYFYR
ncbi:MAG: hypothetical protein IJN34_08255 [Clostridia bacterium]|nr:hypothetical protein [Clostridia bacterium]